MLVEYQFNNMDYALWVPHAQVLYNAKHADPVGFSFMACKLIRNPADLSPYYQTDEGTGYRVLLNQPTGLAPKSAMQAKAVRKALEDAFGITFFDNRQNTHSTRGSGGLQSMQFEMSQHYQFEVLTSCLLGKSIHQDVVNLDKNLFEKTMLLPFDIYDKMNFRTKEYSRIPFAFTITGDNCQPILSLNKAQIQKVTTLQFEL